MARWACAGDIARRTGDGRAVAFVTEFVGWADRVWIGRRTPRRHAQAEGTDVADVRTHAVRVLNTAGIRQAGPAVAILADRAGRSAGAADVGDAGAVLTERAARAQSTEVA